MPPGASRQHRPVSCTGQSEIVVRAGAATASRVLADDNQLISMIRKATVTSGQPIGRPFVASLVGFGYWGPNLARNLSASRDFDLKYISDISSDCLESAKHLYRYSTCVADPAVALSDPDVDVVFVATPASTHFELCQEALRNGKNVLVEKPLTLDATSSEALVRLARQQGLMLAVDHTFVFTGAVQKLRELVVEGKLGALRYFDSIRMNLGLVQPDINVLWDLAVHDLSILRFVTDRVPVAVSATGRAHAPSTQTSTAYMTLFYEDDFIAHIGTSWMSPVKIRRSLLAGTRQMVVYDDQDAGQQVKLFDSGVETSSAPGADRRRLVQTRVGDMLAPKVDTREALAVELKDLASCMRGEVEPLVPGESGLDIVRVLEAATRSLDQNGSSFPVIYDSS